MVHITKETKNLRNKPYNIELSTKIVNNEPTYLVKPCLEKVPPQNGVIGGTRNPHTNPGHHHENQRRKTVFVRRFSTDLINRDNEIPNARSFSMIGSYPDQENGCISVEIERRKDFTLENAPPIPLAEARGLHGSHMTTCLKVERKRANFHERQKEDHGVHEQQYQAVPRDVGRDEYGNGRNYRKFVVFEVRVSGNFG